MTDPTSGRGPATYDTVVFAGGGIRIVSMAGVLTTLDEAGLRGSIKNVIGSSAGAGMAVLTALGLRGRLVEELMAVMDFASLTPKSEGWWTTTSRLKKHFGWHDHDNIRRLYAPIVAKHLGSERATMADLFRKTGVNVGITTTVFNTNSTVLITHETHPDHPVLLALCKSMALPPVFTPVPDADGTLYVDGGFRANIPIGCFGEREDATLVCTVEGDGDHVRKTPQNLWDYIRDMVEIAYDNIGVTWLGPATQKIVVPVGKVSSTDMGLDVSGRRKLIANGHAAARLKLGPVVAAAVAALPVTADALPAAVETPHAPTACGRNGDEKPDDPADDYAIVDEMSSLRDAAERTKQQSSSWWFW